MTGFAELVAAATVGLARRRVDVAGVPAELGYRHDPHAPLAAAVLEAAALFDGARRVEAGRVSGSAEVITAAAETMPALASTATLWQVVGERKIEVLAQALRRMQQHRYRLPDLMLPAVLDLACEQTSLRALVEPVLGARGRLLREHNPRWAWTGEAAIDPHDDQIWEHGTIAERIAWLRALRRLDPDQARDRLQQVWPAETAAHRGRLLAACEVGLAQADEAWLEDLLGQPGVAQIARDLLVRLPDSHLVARARQRVRTTLSVRGGDLLFDHQRLGQGLPAPTLITDGLDRGSTVDKLNNLVALIGSAAWPDLLGIEVNELLACRLPGLGQEAGLGRGLARVAIAEANSDLAIPLVHRFEMLRTDAQLMALVPMSDRENLIGWALRRVGHDEVPIVLSGGGWTDSVAMQVVAWLASGEANGLRSRVLRIAGHAMPAVSRTDYAADLRDLPHHTRISPAERSAAFAAATSIILRRKLTQEIT